jgi:hypothetical protein
MASSDLHFKDTEDWWSVSATLAWIRARDVSAVATLCAPLPAADKLAILWAARAEASVGGKPPIFLRFRLKTIRDARRELIRKLAAGEVTAYGDRGNGLKPIPAVEFSRALGPFEDGTDRVGPHRDVKIARTEVLRCWPDPAKKPAVLKDDLRKWLRKVDDGMLVERKGWPAAQKHFKGKKLSQIRFRIEARKERIDRGINRPGPRG